MNADKSTQTSFFEALTVAAPAEEELVVVDPFFSLRRQWFWQDSDIITKRVMCSTGRCPKKNTSRSITSCPGTGAP